MGDTTTLTIRVPANLKRRLDKLARKSKLSKSWLATDAVEQYVAEQERQATLDTYGVYFSLNENFHGVILAFSSRLKTTH